MTMGIVGVKRSSQLPCPFGVAALADDVILTGGAQGRAQVALSRQETNPRPLPEQDQIRVQEGATSIVGSIREEAVGIDMAGGDDHAGVAGEVQGGAQGDWRARDGRPEVFRETGLDPEDSSSLRVYE